MDVCVLESLMKALWESDEVGATKYISELLWRTISYNDYHEDYYHAFLAGTFVGIGYEVDSNKERGLGRPDILLKDRNNRRAIIIEAKKRIGFGGGLRGSYSPDPCGKICRRTLWI